MLQFSEEMLADFLLHAGFIAPGQSARALPQWEKWIGFRQPLRNSPAVVSFRDDIQRLTDFTAPPLLVKCTGSTPWLHNVIDVLRANVPNALTMENPGGHAPHLVSMGSL